MNRTGRPRFGHASSSEGQSEYRTRTHTPSWTPAWAENTGSIHMVQPNNVLNASAGPAPIMNFTFNGENTSTSSSRQVCAAETVVAARADHEIYYHQLLTKKRGSPLWVPGPGMQLPIEYRRQGTSIGDVGIIASTGEFDFFFNLFLPADHPINDGFVPQTFSPLRYVQLQRDIQKSRVYGKNSYLASSSVRKTGINCATSPVDQTFESTASEAAVLTMPVGASTQNLLNTFQIHQCIAKNARNWYDYARHERGRTVKNGDIRVVVGIDKVESWGIATSTCNTGQAASFAFKLDNHTHFYRWECTGGSGGRVGPEEMEIQDLIRDNTVLQNQCVFVRTMNFTFSGEIWDHDFPLEAVPHATESNKSRKSASSSRGRSSRHIASGRRGTSSSNQPQSMEGLSRSMLSITFDPMEYGVDHPTVALHAHLHEKFPRASMVITQDSDWISVLNDDDTSFPNPGDLLARIIKSSNPTECGGIVSLIAADTMNIPALVFSRNCNTATMSSSPSLTNGAGVNVLATKRHPKYYIQGADLHVVVRTTWFRIHSYFFIRESTLFRRKVHPVTPETPREGLTEKAPIMLENISPEDFETFLGVFYNPRYSIYDTSVEQWKVILKLANLWGFKEVKELAVRELHKKPELDLVGRLALYQDHQVDSCHLIPLYELLCARDTPLSLKESKILGLETTVLIARMQEQLRAPPSNDTKRGLLPDSLELTDVYRAFEGELNLEKGVIFLRQRDFF